MAMRTYNLFRRRDRAELICAVPEDTPVPAFIRGPPWELVGGVDDTGISSLTFNHEAAEVSVRYNGFYLFQLINASDLQLLVKSAAQKRTVGRAYGRGNPIGSGPIPCLAAQEWQASGGAGTSPGTGERRHVNAARQEFA